MTHTGIRSRATGIFAGAGALSLLLGATALLVAPSANADQAAVAGSHNPPGNNGTVKIEGADIQSGPPDNNPHQGCTFSVEFYNYDEGDYNATVTFEDQAPTKDGGLQVVSGNLHPFIGEDAAGGGTDLDAREVYTLKFTGQPQPQQGYHVKLTVNAPGSIGNDVKHKVFWVQGCDAPPTTPPTSPPTTTDTPPTTPPTTTDTPPTTPPTTTDTPPTTPPTTTDTPPTTAPTTPPSSPSTTPTSPGTPTAPTTSTSPSSTSPVATTSTPAPDVPSGTPTPGVPTEVDAGFGGPGSSANSVAGSNSPFGLAGGLLLTVGGLLLTGAGVVAFRRRGKHSV
ncbi:hypothetical protein [Kribbella pratensis]|uniref:LPXTG-motif cell wall-anchored protein n=1 Tax=Kribbella pratensis TaxID=2512112 RepID=A0A4R8CFL2_9ACTN|nr:hypothetical protein [Kribbella pratensis]TDW75068.1 hypothetical protein EV653_0182 [Kribbella pratensis]